MSSILKSIFYKTNEGTTERLVQLSVGYFFLYVITGFLAKYFDRVLGVSSIQYTFYNTIGGMFICNFVVLLWGWYKFKSSTYIKFLGISMPKEFLYIIPSGICTAIIIPTTTLMYTLPISVMVAMIIMRASVIIISRFIDEAQIRQGILKKKVYWEENIAVVFALLAVSLKFFYVKPGDFDFIHNVAAVTILTFYLSAYTIRIYIMNYYKNTRPKGAVYDTKGFFAIEQISSTLFICLVGFMFFKYINKPITDIYNPVTKTEIKVDTIEKQNLLDTINKAEAVLSENLNNIPSSDREKLKTSLALSAEMLKAKKANIDEINKAEKELQKNLKVAINSFSYQYRDSIANPTDKWFSTIISGLPFGLAAFFSVFLFMFKGRTATFAGLVNRITSLIAGTFATLITFLLIKGQKPPQGEDWFSLILLFVAIYFIAKAEKKRACELMKENEIEFNKNSELNKDCKIN